MKTVIILRYLSKQVGSYLTSILPRTDDRIIYYLNGEDRQNPCLDPVPYLGIVSRIEHHVYAEQSSPGRVQHLQEVYVDLRSWERVAEDEDCRSN